MSEKFKYAPGKPGFGTKGDVGIDGNQGLAMYFTDFNPATQSSAINALIQNNQALWTGPATPLPGGRVYVTGDLFFDSNGKVYEIDASSNTFTSVLGTLNMGGFFVPLGVSSSDGFQRYFNTNSGEKIIIDNVYTISGAIDYTQVPSSIYGIVPVNFARIEYTDIKPGAGVYNAFSVYSSGQTAGADDNKALAIVYDEATKTFRIGNLDNTGNVRNTNLTFDVSLLKHSKDSGGYFSVNTPQGAILTNYEMAANSLFNPNFNSAPSSFFANMGPTDVSLNWNLLDFTNDPLVTGDLYFYERFVPYNGRIFNTTDVSVRPLIFSNVEPTGKIRVTGISSAKAYSYYMKLYKNGWTRNSDVKTAFLGIVNVTPTSYMLEPSIAHHVGEFVHSPSGGFKVAANNTWDVSLLNTGNWMYNLVCTSVGSGNYDGSIYFDLSTNSLTTRSGFMKVTLLGGTTQFVQIQQKGLYIDVSVDASVYYTNKWGTVDSSSQEKWYELKINNRPLATIVDISLNWISTMYDTYGGSHGLLTYFNYIRFFNTGVTKNHIVYSNGTMGMGQYSYTASGYCDLSTLTTADFPLYLQLRSSATFPSTPFALQGQTSMKLVDVSIINVSGPPINVFEKFGFPAEASIYFNKP